MYNRMVSLQAEGNYWYHFPNEPHVNLSDHVNYVNYPKQDQPLPLDIAFPDNSFTWAYKSYAKRFKTDEPCTLFVPRTSPQMDRLLDALQHYTSPSHTDKLMRLHVQSEIEILLQMHMCRYMYLPTQLRNHVRMENLTMTRIDYENGCLQNDPSNRIELYQLLENQAIYFISHELYEVPSNPL